MPLMAGKVMKIKQNEITQSYHECRRLIAIACLLSWDKQCHWSDERSRSIAWTLPKCTVLLFALKWVLVLSRCLIIVNILTHSYMTIRTFCFLIQRRLAQYNWRIFLLWGRVVKSRNFGGDKSPRYHFWFGAWFVRLDWFTCYGKTRWTKGRQSR